MKLRNCLLSVILASIVFLGSGCRHEKAGWRGTISQKDGVITISNPEKPMYSGQVMNLEEELMVGGVGRSGESAFSSFQAVDIDEDQNIFILSTKDAAVFVYDRSGIFMRKFGRLGQGPGESIIPVAISIRADRVMISDRARKISFFRLSGDFINSFSVGQYSLLETSLDARGNIYGLEAGMSGDNPAFKLLKFDQEMKLKGEVARYLVPEPQKGLDPFMSSPFFQVGPDNTVIFSRPESYIFEYYDDNGKLIRQVKKAYKPVRITDEEKNEMKRKLPSHQGSRFAYHPGCGRFICSDEGWLLVQTFEKSAEGYYIFDVFDEQGRFLTKIPLPGEPKIWKKGKLYCREEDEAGFQLLIRYSLQWKK
ncbi:MAG: 6-bladed beta-propeller [Acidobacteriota bacterium]|nr:6-bladed beta-propeller [Acidobacteriota bacterium]